MNRAAALPERFRMGGLGRHSLVYAAGIIATKAVSFLMMPIYTRLLSPADYGVLQLIVMFLEVLSIFAGSRIAYGIFHFYHKAADEEARRKVLSTVLLLLCATFGVAAIVSVLAAPQIAIAVFGEAGQYSTYVRLGALSMACESLIVVPNALFQLQQRSIRFVTFSLLRLGLQVGLNLLFLIPLRLGVTGVLLTGVISNLLVGGFLAAQLLWTVKPRFEWTAARQFLRFGIPLVVMQVATFTFTFADRYFLNKAGDTTAVGLYALAYQFGFLVGTIGYIPIEMVWDPQRFAVARRPDRDVIYARVFIYINIVLISAAVGLSLFVGDVLRVIADPAFHAAATFVPVIVGAYVFQAWGTFFNIGIMLKERTHYWTLANWAAAAVAVGGYLVLIPRYLAWGAAITVVASLGTRFWLTHLFSQRLLPIRYEWGPVLRLIVIAVALASVGALAPTLGIVSSVTVHTVLFGLYSLLVWRLILTASDRAAARSLLLGVRGHMARASADG
jgi:O-antigen/teichoic acid export membrane protein